MVPTPTPPGAGRRDLWLAFLLPTLVALAFVTKPVHQDDWAYLRAAAFLLEDPATFLDQTTLYQGMPITVAQGVLHGPVWMWVLALCLLFGGAAVMVAHVASALCLGLLGWASASLAGPLGAPRLATALVVTLSPLPLVLAGNLMTDLPMLAFFAAALALAARGYERGSTGALLGAGLVAAATALTRYHGMAVLPMLAVMPFLWPRRGLGLGRALLPLGLAVLLVGGYLAATSLLQGRADSSRATSAFLDELAKIDQTACLLSALAAMGGSLLGLAVACLAAPGRAVASLRGRVGLVVAVLALVAAVGASVVAEGRGGVQPVGVNLWLQRLLFLVGAAGALVAAGRVVAGGEPAEGETGLLAGLRARRGRETFLLLWLGGFLVAAWLTVPFGSSRYALPLVPALLLLASAAATRAFGARVVRLAVAPVAVVGLAAAIADLGAARVYPAHAEAVAAARAAGEEHAAGNLWIWGELDFRWYLEEHPGLADTNAAPLPADPTDPATVFAPATTPPRVLGRRGFETGLPVAGDKVLRSSLCTSSPDGLSGIYQLPRELVNRMENAALVPFEDAWPVRIHNSYAAAGFYHADGGLLPFALSTVPHERLQTFRIVDANPFLESFDRALVETTDAVTVAGGNVKVEPFRVAHFEELGIELKSAVSITFPGRVTWQQVPVRPGATRLEFLVAEGDSTRLYPGPGALLRVRLDGEVAWELALDSRRDPSVRRWIPAAVDLRPVAGRAVDVTLEVVEGAWPDKPEDHGGPAGTSVGFAELRIL